jgi:hypothetical protein
LEVFYFISIYLLFSIISYIKKDYIKAIPVGMVRRIGEGFPGVAAEAERGS